jgi:hypothetical protein
MLMFKATILIRGVNPYVLVSKNRAAKLKAGWHRPMPVTVWINGQPRSGWPINMMPVGDGSFYLYLHGDVRKASKTAVGDKVEVKVQFDAAYKNGPMHPMPSWFAVPLSENKAAQKGWNALPPSRQKEILRYLAGLKSSEAQSRNVEKALHVLSGKSGRYMARNWKNGV